MEKKEENYIRQLLLELDEYLFSLRWYDKEDREIMLKNIIGFDSIFQIIPKRFRKLLEGRIYTQEELDKAREEGRREGSEITSRYISDFVKSESGKSGRKEILEYIDKLSKYQFTRSKHLKREGVKRRNICQGILDRSRRWKKV